MTFKRTLLALLLSAPFLGAQTSNLLIENVTLIDGTGKDPRSGVSVLIQGDRIHRISGVRIDAIADIETIDGSGRFLIPGLMDMHVHLQGGRGRQGPNRDRAISRLHSFLYSGVTTIYDAGNSPDFLFGLRDEEREGTLESPRIFGTGGIVTYPGSHGASPVAILIDSWPADRELLIQHLDRAPDVLKLTYEERGWGIRPLIPLLPQELMSRIIREANLRGIRTTVHTSSELRAREAIAAGTDTLAHPVIQGPVTDDFVKLMAAKRIPMVSTLTIGEGYSRLAEQPEFLDQPLYRDTLPAAERQRFLVQLL